MSNYTQTTDFSAKDNLTSGNAAKVIKGSEVDAEFSAIATAISSKQEADTTIIPAGTIMLFIAKFVPSGWSLVNTWNDKSLVLNSSITSSNAYTTGGNWSVSATEYDFSANVPSHTHAVGNLATATTNANLGFDDSAYTPVPGALSNHTHTINGNTGNPNSNNVAISFSKSGTMTSGNWRPAYVEIIACSKD
jgi:hypothetical protein